MRQVNKAVIVGVGLIGASVGLALRARNLARIIVGVGRDMGRLQVAAELGAITEATTDIQRGAADSDLVVVCTPVTRIAQDVSDAARHAPPSALITDAGSTKEAIVQLVESDPIARSVFVAAHPIAGSERKGAAHGQADLFEGRLCILTPTPVTPMDKLRQARDFWSGIGCRIAELDPVSHDQALAITSHLPHVVAAALAASTPPDLLPFAGGAFRDGTRVAAADTDLWTGIFLANRHHLAQATRNLKDRLESFLATLEQGDESALQAWWDMARTTRLRYDTCSISTHASEYPAGSSPL